MKLKKSDVVTVCVAFLLSAAACAGSGSEERAGSSAPSSRSVRSAEPFSTVLPPAAVKRWEEKAPLHTARYDFSTETVGGRIYAIGGENRSGFLSSAEAYDPKTDTWKTIQSMSVPRSNAQTIVLDGKIYVFGGYTSGPNAPVCTGSAERYDPKTDTRERHPVLPKREPSFRPSSRTIPRLGNGRRKLPFRQQECILV